MVEDTSWPTLLAAEFAHITAKIYAWTNHAHPFREDSDRATKLWLASVAGQSPWRLNFERVDADVWNQAPALSGPDRGQITPDPGRRLLRHIRRYLRLVGGWVRQQR